MGVKDTREVRETKMPLVVVPVRRGKGNLSVRYPDLEKAVKLARDGGGKIVFDFPDNDPPVDIGLMVRADSVEVGSEPEIRKVPAGNFGMEAVGSGGATK